MKKLLVLAVLSACLALVHAANVPGAGEGGNGSISGTITDQNTGAPIAGAKVMAGCCRSAVTRGDGTYTIANLPAGTYTVKAKKCGEYEMGTYPQPVKVEAGQQVTGIDIALKPCGGGGGSGSISGCVYDERTGEPVEGAKVTAGCQKYAMTGKDGGYTITDLADGSYTVKATKCGYECATYPKPVVIANGQPVTGVDFYLVPKLEGALD